MFEVLVEAHSVTKSECCGTGFAGRDNAHAAVQLLKLDSRHLGYRKKSPAVKRGFQVRNQRFSMFSLHHRREPSEHAKDKEFMCCMVVTADATKARWAR